MLPVVRDTTLEPGEATSVVLDFEMGMHRGMDGPHLFRVRVPVSTTEGEPGSIALYFQADFR